MRLPEIQNELRELAKKHKLPRLTYLANQMSRRKGTRANVSSLTVTPSIRKKIIELKRKHPRMTQFEIAEKCRVNQGRVSEVLRGKRK